MVRLAHRGTTRGKLQLSELVRSVGKEGRQGYHEELCFTLIVRKP